VRVAGVVVGAAVCAFMLGASANSARTQGGVTWTLRPVASGQKWLRVDVAGDMQYGFRARGTSFSISGIKSVRASGGPAPQCAVTGDPATLACDGELPGGISVFVQLLVAGGGGSYDFAVLFSPGDPESDLLYIPSTERAAPVPIGGSLGFTSAGTARVTIANASSTRSFQRLEVAPIGFQARAVASPDCGITEGGGIACQRNLGPRRTAVLRFTPDSRPSAASAVLSAYGSDIGFGFVQAGSPCPDLIAAVAQTRSEASIVRAHLALLARVANARRYLRPLRRKLAVLDRQVAAEQRNYVNCSAGTRKTAAGSACDADALRVANAAGRAAGLRAVLPTDRLIAVKVKQLRAFSRTTQKKLTAAKGTLERATQRLAVCQASLAQS
jgi:hypothetical protein